MWCFLVEWNGYTKKGRYCQDRMKIAMVISNLDIAGAQVMVVELLVGLVRKNYECQLIVLGNNESNILHEQIKKIGVKVKYLSVSKKGYISRKIERYKKLSEILTEEQPDIIHAHLDYRYTWLYCILNNKIVIETMHSQAYRIKNLMVWCEYKLLRKKKLIYPVVLSKSNACEFGQLFNESKDNITIIPNPVNCEKFSVPNRTYLSEIINFVFVARFEEIKNHDMLLRAFSIAEKEMPNIRLLLVGDGSLLKKEKQLVKRLGVESKVIFKGQRNNIPDILKESDICVISSKSEAFSIALVEAMAAGLPVIVTSVGGMRDIVDGNGVLVENDDEYAFAEAMMSLACDEKKRKLMGERSVQLAQQYNTENIIEQYIELYKRCIY